MRKDEMVRRIVEETGLTYVKAEQVINAVLDEIKSALQQGDSVILRRFGSFDVRDKRARMGRNPQTGQPINIPAKRVAKFSAGKALKEAI